MSDKKVKIAIDDNRRLNLRDYRALIYDELKKRNQDSAQYRIR